MPKSPSTPVFKIHVDPSCLTDSTNLQMVPAERAVSDQTVVHHDSWSEEKASAKCDELMDEVAVEAKEEIVNYDVFADETFEDEKVRDARHCQIDRIEAQIQAAARAVVATIEKDNYGQPEKSVLSAHAKRCYEKEEKQIVHHGRRELTSRDGAERTCDDIETSYVLNSEHEEDADGDSSSHHDGDIDNDDVFSRESDHSARSSLNSMHDVSSSDEIQGKELTSPRVGEEAIQCSPAPDNREIISKNPSSSSYLPHDASPITPSKALSRQPFRRLSSVRAMQMSSPTPSIISSPRSSKRRLPNVSRVGTPTSSHSLSKNRTPTRFRAKKEYPLVLLHVTVLPLIWSYSHVITTSELPDSLERVNENWRLLQDKLGDIVLDRGILLPHPQDSYEILEERLLEALELPVWPRARILSCGHYLSPDTPSSEDEGAAYSESGTKLEGDRRWCDVCGQGMRLEGLDVAGRKGEKRFRTKIYASNGLMTAGAWAACWREMERIDVEIEPFVEEKLVKKLEDFAAVFKVPEAREEEGDGFVDEETGREEDDAYYPEFHVGLEADERAQQEEEMTGARTEEDMLRQCAQEEEDTRRKVQDEQRLREVYGYQATLREHTRPRTYKKPSSKSPLDDDYLPALLFKAFKLAMRDKRNVMICILSLMVFILALRPGSTAPNRAQMITTDAEPAKDVGLKSIIVPTRDSGGKAANCPMTAREPPEAIGRDTPPGEKDTHAAEGFVTKGPTKEQTTRAEGEQTSTIGDTAHGATVELARSPADSVSEQLPLEAAMVGSTHLRELLD